MTTKFPDRVTAKNMKSGHSAQQHAAKAKQDQEKRDKKANRLIRYGLATSFAITSYIIGGIAENLKVPQKAKNMLEMEQDLFRSRQDTTYQNLSYDILNKKNYTAGLLKNEGYISEIEITSKTSNGIKKYDLHITGSKNR